MNQNELYPIFLKVAQLEVLIVGGGNVGLEKLTFLLKSSPNAKVTVVAKDFHPELMELAKKHTVKIIEDSYQVSYLKGKHMVIATTDSIDVNIQVYKDCKAQHILVNVADNPPYCDFYMGGIITKGNVKIAISTNGKSPTLAKRLRQFFEDVIPDNIDELAENLNKFRKTIKGDFSNKVTQLNKLTEKLL
ncbi:bifunctional precorrin-2 dehydrogenase/sirohydrochlorin ferrochelatase [Lutibacter sp.]|uniref:precorrin-2 dehydrogenase/sirohydrochlorin ferrochelatase family protein n=1 Tax=Lutibacter sp. TaxID=1925666 RepID=UPI00356520B6